MMYAPKELRITVSVVSRQLPGNEIIICPSLPKRKKVEDSHTLGRNCVHEFYKVPDPTSSTEWPFTESPITQYWSPHNPITATSEPTRQTQAKLLLCHQVLQPQREGNSPSQPCTKRECGNTLTTHVTLSPHRAIERTKKMPLRKTSPEEGRHSGLLLGSQLREPGAGGSLETRSLATLV